MKTAPYFTRRALPTAVALPLLVSACAMLGPSAERWTPPPAGASWEIVQRNTGSYGQDARVRVTRGDGVWQGAPVFTLANSQGFTTMVAQNNGHWIAIAGREGKALMSWDPPVGFEYPLSVGKSWVTPYRLSLAARGKTLPFEMACNIEAYEKVSVKAGTFDAFKIFCTTDIGTEETYWTSPTLGVFVKTQLRRTDKNPFGPGTQDAELVSAPALPR